MPKNVPKAGPNMTPTQPGNYTDPGIIKSKKAQEAPQREGFERWKAAGGTMSNMGGMGSPEWVASMVMGPAMGAAGLNLGFGGWGGGAGGIGDFFKNMIPKDVSQWMKFASLIPQQQEPPPPQMMPLLPMKPMQTPEEMQAMMNNFSKTGTLYG